MRFSTAQKKSIIYLQSDEFKSREDSGDTLSSIPVLIEINNLGLITDQSQEGTISKGYNPDTKRYYRIEERAFVGGCMKEEKAYKFVRKINETSDKIAFVVRADSSKEYKKVWDSGDIPSIPVTVQGSSEKSQASIKELQAFTIIPLAMPPEVFGKPYTEISEKIQEVIVIDPVYGRKATSTKGIYKDVIRTLKEIR